MNDQVTQVGGFICIVGRPLLHRPSTCPQATEHRSPCRDGMRQYVNYGSLALYRDNFLSAGSNQENKPVKSD